MDKNKLKVNKRQRRHGKVRARVSGTEKRPRFSVFRSNKGIYVQLVDDISGRTLVSGSSKDKEIEKLRNREIKGTNDTNNTNTKVDEAFGVGELVAKKALDLGIKRVVFDRGGYKYHGRVKAVADGARKGGLKF